MDPRTHPERATVLITGASSGIGFHLAHEFAKHGHTLILVAPDEAELRAVAESLGAPTRTVCIGADLEDADAVPTIMARIAAEGLEVDILCNNAGHGFRGLFWEVDLATHLSIIRLNIEAVIRLTAEILPKFVARGRGRILNTASVAGFEPGPTMAVYHATKAFVLSWSEAIATELADTGVTVTALCPGATDTDFFPKAEMENSAAFQKGPLAAPQDVARDGYEALMAGDRVIVSGAANKAMVFSRRFLSESMQASMTQKQYADVPPDDRHRERGDVESRKAS